MDEACEREDIEEIDRMFERCEYPRYKKQEILYNCCKKGQLVVVRHLISGSLVAEYDMCDVFARACYSGNMELILWVTEQVHSMGITYITKGVKWASLGGSLESLDFLAPMARCYWSFNWDAAWVAACRAGSEETLDWLACNATVRYRKCYAKALAAACTFGHVRIAERITAECDDIPYFPRDKIFFDTCTRGHRDAAAWLLDRFGPIDPEFLNRALMRSAISRSNNNAVELLIGVVSDPAVIVKSFGYACYAAMFSNACVIYDSTDVITDENVNEVIAGIIEREELEKTELGPSPTMAAILEWLQSLVSA